MSFMQNVIGLILGWLAGSMFLVVLPSIRVGIPMCNQFIKKRESVIAARDLRKRYFFSLIIWIPIIVVLTFLCHMYLGIGFYAYLTVFIFMIVLGFNASGINENNLLEFYHSLNNAIDRNAEAQSEYEETEKKVKLATIVSKALGASSVFEAYKKAYSFYKEINIDINDINPDPINPYDALAQLVMRAMETDNLDDTIEKAIDFYESQGIKVR